MSVQSEITRIQTARNTIRTKEIALGIATAADDLTALATKLSAVVDNGTPDAEVKEGETYNIAAGYYHGGTVKGVAGGGSYNLQAKSVIPTKSQQTIGPDSGYYGLSTVTVNAIPAEYQDVTAVTATAADVLATKIIVNSSGVVTTGTMANNGAISKTLDATTKDAQGNYTNRTYTVPTGYHNGSGSVSITVDDKTATPTESVQTITPDTGHVLGKVVIAKIPETYMDASGGGTTPVTATAADILSGVTAIGYNTDTEKAVKLTGTMTNNGAVSPSALQCGESYTVPAGYHNGSGVVTAASLASQTGVDSGKTAVTAAMIVTGYQGWVNGAKVSGTMADNSSKASGTLDCGQVYNIPKGYYPSDLTVTANSLASQTGVDSDKSAITATQVLTGFQGWVNGNKISGTMANLGAIAGTITGLGVVTGDTSYTIAAGYTSGGTVSLTSDIETALAAI